MDKLPPELIDQILHYLSYHEYWLCQKTCTIFHVSSKDEYERRKVEPSLIEELPPELIDQILHYLADKEYWHCRKASKIFHVSSKDEYKRRKCIRLHVYARNYNMLRVASGCAGLKYTM